MKNLVIIGTIFPEPNSTAAGKRMLQLINFFRSENFKIYFLSTSPISEHSFPLNEWGIETHLIHLNNNSFEKLISKINPNVVLFDRFIVEEQFGWKISETCPNAIKILDTEDLHFLRKVRETNFKKSKITEFNDYISEYFKREIASILRCDLSLIISEYELKLLTEIFNLNKEILHYLPLFAENSSSNLSYHERKNFISIGNFLHEPNWQTVLKLKKIWKTIKMQLPEAELHIYGAYASQKAFELHNEKEGYLVKGRAENLEKIFNEARVLLAPIPFGAGIKGKLLDSMRFGTPNITTSVGAEAMHGNMDWNGFIADDDEFTKKAVVLYQDENVWEKAQQNGYKIINSRYKKEQFLPQFSEKIMKIQKHLSAHRNRNFLGQILQHHTLQSTKYMSKWIEEKNKNG